MCAVRVMSGGGELRFEGWGINPERCVGVERLWREAWEGSDRGEFECIVNTNDFYYEEAGDYCFSNLDEWSGDLVPDFLFSGWGETFLGDYEELIRRLGVYGESRAETDNVGWVGRCLVDRREELVERFRGSGFSDFRDMSWGSSVDSCVGYMSMESQVGRWRYLLDIEGHSWSARLKLLFFTNRVVFMVDRPWREYWYRWLVPWEHYVPVRRDLSDLGEKYNLLMGDLELESRILSNAREFAGRYLRRASAVGYLRGIINGIK